MSRKTAAETYAERASDIAAMLDLIGQELKAHKERAEAEPEDWGFAGDLGHVHERFREVLGFISGIDEDAIDETLEEIRKGKWVASEAAPANRSRGTTGAWDARRKE
ncbi:MAG: hypothetical protein ACYS9X_13775 [Planctomycetota bacterium]|jgi:hypothetical protein